MTNTRDMGRKKKGRERVQITLPPGMADELSDAAAERGWDRSQLIEDLAAAFLKAREETAEPKKKGK